MKKYLVLLFLLSLTHCLLLAQQENRMELVSSLYSRLDAVTGNMINYRPVYQHKGSNLRADSGYIYTDDLKREFFDAYGNVVITQPDGTIIFADKLNYAADPQLAVLTGNVRMVDGKSVLTTNYLTYNMKSSIGTYTGGGRIVNETDTITSEKAWYFNQTKDAYFRMNVIVRTPDVHIFTDTMRYNSGSKTTFFYGPTNLKGNKGENLYTEDGYYNTETELAEFFKNNLYTEKSRLLKGDTLYYDGKSGNGRALNNVLFIDTADRFSGTGMTGLYNKEDESIMLTDRALITMAVDKDSTQNDLADSVFLADKEPPKVDSVYMTADTLFSKMILQKDYHPMKFNLDREGGELEEEEEEPTAETVDTAPAATSAPDSTSTGIAVNEDLLKTDSLKTPPDSLKLPDKDILLKQEQNIQTTLAADSVLRQHVNIPQGGEVDSLVMQATGAMLRPMMTDSIPRDSLGPDTARTRIIKAYRNVRFFKSDLQAVADSAYYGYLDSMMRFFGSPMAWNQGTQLSGDSLYLQIKKETIDNMLILGHAFLVNTNQDSSKFNQIKGKKITGFFTNGDLERVFVDGNAESLVYIENDEKTGYTEMHHNRSGRIKVLIKDRELTDFIPIKNSESTFYPLYLVSQEKEILEGFIWKPSDRPVSKVDLLNRKRNQELPLSVEETKPETPEEPDPALGKEKSEVQEKSIKN